MIQFQFGTNQAGHPIIVAVTQETIEALKVMRGMKAAFSDLWQQVNLEIVVPAPGANVVNRILNADGKPNGDKP